MNKKEFLEKLRYELRVLPQEEVDEIIRDQEEFIGDAMASGRSEQEIIAAFKSPKNFADSLKLEHKVGRINNSSSVWGSYKEIIGTTGMLVALTPINLLLLFIIIIPLLSFLLSWLSTSLVFLVFSGFGLLFPFFAPLFFGFSLMQSTTIFFFILGFFFLGLAGLAALYLFSKLFIKLFIVYANWNIDLVKGRI